MKHNFSFILANDTWIFYLYQSYIAKVMPTPKGIVFFTVSQRGTRADFDLFNTLRSEPNCSSSRDKLFKLWNGLFCSPLTSPLVFLYTLFIQGVFSRRTGLSTLSTKVDEGNVFRFLQILLFLKSLISSYMTPFLLFVWI